MNSRILIFLLVIVTLVISGGIYYYFNSVVAYRTSPLVKPTDIPVSMKKNIVKRYASYKDWAQKQAQILNSSITVDIATGTVLNIGLRDKNPDIYMIQLKNQKGEYAYYFLNEELSASKIVSQEGSVQKAIPITSIKAGDTITITEKFDSMKAEPERIGLEIVKE